MLDRYKEDYDTREKMGMLTFSDLEITILSKDAALVFGRWHLQRPKTSRTAASRCCSEKQKTAGELFTITRRARETVISREPCPQVERRRVELTSVDV